MKNKKTKLWHHVDLILWEKWDPNGVNDCDAGRDEYYSYIRAIVRLIEDGPDSYKLSRHLHQLRTVCIGLGPNSENDKLVADLLIIKDEKKFYDRKFFWFGLGLVSGITTTALLIK